MAIRVSCVLSDFYLTSPAKTAITTETKHADVVCQSFNVRLWSFIAGHPPQQVHQRSRLASALSERVPAMFPLIAAKFGITPAVTVLPANYSK